MMPTIRFLLIAVVLGAQSSVLAETPAFSVVVVGNYQRQAVKLNGKLVNGVPWADSVPTDQAIIRVPTETRSNKLAPDELTYARCYVMIRNVSSEPVRLLSMSARDWFNCLEFSLAAANGQTFSIHRPTTQAWTRNPAEPWIFPPDGVKIIPVDFTSGSWQGFPSRKEIPDDAPCKIKVTFKYANGAKAGSAEQRFESKPITVVRVTS